MTDTSAPGVYTHTRPSLSTLSPRQVARAADRLRVAQSASEAGESRRSFYVSVRTKYFIVLLCASTWALLSVWLSLRWLHDLSAVLGFPLALFSIAFIAHCAASTAAISCTLRSATVASAQRAVNGRSPNSSKSAGLHLRAVHGSPRSPLATPTRRSTLATTTLIVTSTRNSCCHSTKCRHRQDPQNVLLLHLTKSGPTVGPNARGLGAKSYKYGSAC